MVTANTYIFMGVQLGVWTAVAVITRLSWLGFDFEPPGWDSLISYAAIGLITSTALAAMFIRMYEWPIKRQLSGAIVLTILAGLLWRGVYNGFEYYVIEQSNDAFEFWGYFHDGRTSMPQMMVWSGAFWIIHYYNKYTQQRLQALAAKAQFQAAKLRQLQNQINPHFLFNTLGGLDTLLLKNSVSDARFMLGKLTDYLRQTLENEPNAEAPLAIEIGRTEGYLEIEKIRAGNRLKVNWHLPETLPDIAVPTGILLPLVENALKHGAINSRVGGYLDIVVSTDKTHLSIQLENDTRPTSKPGFGIGLSNTRDRLDTLYGNKASLTVSQHGNLFKAIIRVPR